LPPPTVAQATTTVDTAAPTSSVDVLPASSPASFTVSWSGNDGTGSGVDHFDVYVSDNHGSFTAWLIGTTNDPTGAVWGRQLQRECGIDVLVSSPGVTATPANPVPEPPAVVLLAILLAGLVLWLRTRKRVSAAGVAGY